MENLNKKASVWAEKSKLMLNIYKKIEQEPFWEYITPEALRQMYHETEALYGFTITEFTRDINGIWKSSLRQFREQSEETDFDAFLKRKLERFPKIYEYFTIFFDFSKVNKDQT